MKDATMLDFSRHGTFQDGTGYDWDYFGDDQDAQAFYIVPRPQFAMIFLNRSDFISNKSVVHLPGGFFGFVFPGCS